MRLAVFVISFSFLSFTVGQAVEPPVRELPAWMVYTYYYGVSPVTTALALLARAGWFTTRTAAQGAWDTGKFIYENPVAASLVIPANLFIAYKLYKEGLQTLQELRDNAQEWAIKAQFEASPVNQPQISPVLESMEVEPFQEMPARPSLKRKRGENEAQQNITKKQRVEAFDLMEM